MDKTKIKEILSRMETYISGVRATLLECEDDIRTIYEILEEDAPVPVEPAPVKAWVTGSGLRIRREPVSGNVIGSLGVRQEVLVASEDADKSFGDGVWVKIISPQEGYVASWFLSKTPPFDPPPVEPGEPQAPSDVRWGVGTAIPSFYWMQQSSIQDLLRTLKPETFHVLTGEGWTYDWVLRLKEVLPPDCVIVVRAYIHIGEEQAHWTPERFAQHWINELTPFYQAGIYLVQFFNEPNTAAPLAEEGYGLLWNNGKEFGEFHRQVVENVQKVLPAVEPVFPLASGFEIRGKQLVEWGFSLPPGTDVNTIFRQGFAGFNVEASSEIQRYKNLSYHSYWNEDAATPPSWAIEDINKIAVTYSYKHIYITEVGSGARSIGLVEKGKILKQFFVDAKQKLRWNVRGLHYFCLNATGDAWNEYRLADGNGNWTDIARGLLS